MSFILDDHLFSTPESIVTIFEKYIFEFENIKNYPSINQIESFIILSDVDVIQIN